MNWLKFFDKLINMFDLHNNSLRLKYVFLKASQTVFWETYLKIINKLELSGIFSYYSISELS